MEIENKTTTDAFGTDRDENGKPVTPPAPVEDDKGGEGKGEGEGEGQGKGKEGDGSGEGSTEAIKSLEKKIDEYGTNLTKQREIIETLQNELKLAKEGKGSAAEEDKPFKDIKYSKDLTKEQREEMTETEIAQMDVIAGMQEQMNKMHETASAAAKATQQAGDDKKVDVKGLAQQEAMALTKGDIEMANKIIKEFNEFAGNDTLTEAQIKERIAKASKLVPEYKAPKEQKGGTGNGKPPASKSGDDPHGVDAIVAEAAKGKKPGSYDL